MHTHMQTLTTNPTHRPRLRLLRNKLKQKVVFFFGFWLAGYCHHLGWSVRRVTTNRFLFSSTIQCQLNQHMLHGVLHMASSHNPKPCFPIIVNVAFSPVLTYFTTLPHSITLVLQPNTVLLIANLPTIETHVPCTLTWISFDLIIQSELMASLLTL